MIVSIHQPQYLPWPSYFLKIRQSDVFIVLDSVDYQKNGLQNRNQIKTAQGAQWLTVPVRHQLGQKILDIEINNSLDWRKKHWATLCHAYGKARYFRLYAEELEQVYRQEWTHLVDLNFHLLRLLMRWMGITTSLLRSSEMQSSGKASELVLNLCREAGATRYLSGTGGQSYLDLAAFEQAGVDVEFSPPQFPQFYSQPFPAVGFLNDLSTLDLLLNAGPDWAGLFGPDRQAQ